MANIEAESDSIHLENEDMYTMIENLSKISTNENSRLDVSETEDAITTPGVSTPMPGVHTSRTGRPIVVPNRLQVGINNILLDVLASKVAEQMLRKSKDFQKSKKDDKSKERKSRKDKYEKKSSDKKENKEKTTRSDSKASDTSKSRNSSATSNG
jgi:hypothetical protein